MDLIIGGRKKAAAALSEFKCPQCRKPLVRRRGTAKDGGRAYDFFGCSGFRDGCKAAYETKDGKPDFSAKEKGGKGGR